MMDTRELLGKWRPKTQIILAGGNERDHQDNRAANVRLHVLHLRNALADPWNNPHDIPLQPVLEKFYAEEIEVERARFVEEMQLTPDLLEMANGRYFYNEVQGQWEGWLCARLGFLPRKQR